MPDDKNNIEDRISGIETALAEYYRLNRIMWDRNILKRKGHWWIELGNNNAWRSSRYRYTKLDPRYPTPATDLCSAQLLSIESNIVKGFPLPYASARVRNEKAKRAAKFNDILLKYYWEYLGMRDKLAKITGWCLDTGGCIGVPYWDMNSGELIEMPKTREVDDVDIKEVMICKACGAYNPVGAEMCINQECNIKNGMTDMLPQTIQTPVKRKQIVVDDMGNAVIEEIRTGDAEFEVSPYYEWLFDPYAEELEDCSFVMRRRAKSIEWIKSVHGKKAEKVKCDRASCEEYWYTARLNSWISGGVHMSYDSSTYLYHHSDDVAPYIEYWQKPVGRKGKGRYVVISGGEKLIDENFPWEDGEYHFIHFRFQKSQGSFYGESHANKIIPVNDRINRIDQNIIWNRQVAIDPIILNHNSTKVPNEDFYGKLGRIVNWQGSVPPVVLEFKGLPAQVYKEREDALRDLEKIGVSDPMQGALPQGRTPAYAVELSIEQSNNKLSKFAFYLSEGIKKWAKETSDLSRKFMTGPRKLQIAGSNNEYEIEAFSGLDLKGDENVKDGGILIEHSFDSVYPKSRASEKQTIIDLMQYGGFNPNDEFNRAVMMDKFGFAEEVNQSFNADKAAAQREIVEMESGIDVSSEYAKKANVDPNMIHSMGGQLVLIDPKTRQPKIDQNTGQPVTISPRILLRRGENVMIHYQIHRDDIQSEAFDRLPANIQEIKRRHFDLTEMAMHMEQQQRMMQQAQMSMVMKGSPSPQKQGAA